MQFTDLIGLVAIVYKPLKKTESLYNAIHGFDWLSGYRL